MKTIFVLFVISAYTDGGVGMTYEFNNKDDCLSVATRIKDQTRQYAFCKEIKK